MASSEQDPEGDRLKKKFRAFQRRFAEVVFCAGLGMAVFLFGIQAVLAHGVTLGSYYAPLGLLALLSMTYLVRKKWGLAAVCGLILAFTAYYLRKTDSVRERRKTSISLGGSRAPAAAAVPAAFGPGPRAGKTA